VKSAQACTVQAKRTCDPGLEQSGDICVPPVDPKEKARVMKAYKTEAPKHEALQASLAQGLQATYEVEKKGGDLHAARRRLMRDALAWADDGFDAVTLMHSVSGGLVVGYGHARGFAMSASPEGGLACREVFGNTFTAGVAAGVSGVEEIGLWKGGIAGLAGETNGVQAAGGVLLVVFTKGLHWAVGAKDPTGITTGLGGSVGLDVGIEYVHGWGKLRCSVDCATLNWDDIPLLDSDASCNR
jgi:hypothetical protein